LPAAVVCDLFAWVGVWLRYGTGRLLRTELRQIG
jgi:hypothetical protein